MKPTVLQPGSQKQWKGSDCVRKQQRRNRNKLWRVESQDKRKIKTWHMNVTVTLKTNPNL